MNTPYCSTHCCLPRPNSVHAGPARPAGSLAESVNRRTTPGTLTWGHGLFFVQGDVVPEATRRALSRRFGGESFIYLFGDHTVISDRVARELASYGHVQRVPGSDPFDLSVKFAGFRDAGLNQGYWIDWWSRDFGWSIAEAGHNFTFVNPDDWQQAVTGSLLSHMGKHGPMILIRPNGPDENVMRYLKMVKPEESAPNDQLNNHGWILGGTDRISWTAQADIDLLPEVKSRDDRDQVTE